MEFIDLEPQEIIVREGSSSFLKINLAKGKEGDREISFISVKKGFYVENNGKKEERIKSSISISFDELPLLIEALESFKKKLESNTFK